MSIVTKHVVFEKRDFDFIKMYAVKYGYGQRGFSVALRHMIRYFESHNDGNFVNDPIEQQAKQGTEE